MKYSIWYLLTIIIANLNTRWNDTHKITCNNHIAIITLHKTHIHKHIHSDTQTPPLLPPPSPPPPPPLEREKESESEPETERHRESHTERYRERTRKGRERDKEKLGYRGQPKKEEKTLRNGERWRVRIKEAFCDYRESSTGKVHAMQIWWLKFESTEIKWILRMQLSCKLTKQETDTGDSQCWIERSCLNIYDQKQSIKIPGVTLWLLHIHAYVWKHICAHTCSKTHVVMHTHVFQNTCGPEYKYTCRKKSLYSLVAIKNNYFKTHIMYPNSTDISYLF